MSGRVALGFRNQATFTVALSHADYDRLLG